MDSLIKMFIFFLCVFFLINNAIADKSASEEGNIASNDITTEAQYNFDAY